MQNKHKSLSVPQMVVLTINEIVSQNDQFLPYQGRITIFHSSERPNFGINYYFDHIRQYGQFSDEVLIAGVIYLDRIMKANPSLVINSYSIHRLLITCLMIGSKFCEDVYYDNGFYAHVGGVHPLEINSLEALFLQLIDFRLFIHRHEYKKCRHLLKSHLKKTKKKRKLKEKQTGSGVVSDDRLIEEGKAEKCEDEDSIITKGSTNASVGDDEKDSDCENYEEIKCFESEKEKISEE